MPLTQDNQPLYDATDQDFVELAQFEIQRRGDRALAYAKEQKDWDFGETTEQKARERHYWDRVIAAIEAIELTRPSARVPDCLLCSYVAEQTIRLPGGGIEQLCAQCGKFRIDRELLEIWSGDGESCHLTNQIQAYLDYCLDRNEVPMLTASTLAWISEE